MPQQRESEQQLFRHYLASGDPRAREAIVERFMPLARSLARRYCRGSEPLEDLEQVACLALVRAVDAFDPSRGTAFTSYAVPSIAGAIKRHFRDHGWAVKVPRELQERALRVQRIREDLGNEEGHQPTAAEVARYARMTVEEVLEAGEAYRALYSDSVDGMRSRGGRDDPAPLLDTLGEPDDELERALGRAALGSVLDTLEERDRTILQLYYRDELTQAEIGRRLGYSQMHISRLLRTAVARLRSTVEAHDREMRTRLAAAS
jgi:RNA polymerase sigma-B factor